MPFIRHLDILSDTPQARAAPLLKLPVLEHSCGCNHEDRPQIIHIMPTTKIEAAP